MREGKEKKKENILNVIGKNPLFFDGGMGTMLQAAGLEAGEIPEMWCFEHPEKIKAIHIAYLEAGANIIETNSFGANALKFHHSKYTSYEVMKTSVEIARESIGEYEKIHGANEHHFVAASIGPCGYLLEPLGEISFDAAYESFKELSIAAKDGGADILLIETMTDSYELKAAILACKENTDLPIIASFMLDEDGKLLTGGSIDTLVPLLEGLRVDAVGLNCGFGPDQMLPFVKKLKELTILPIMINSNAGMPNIDEDGNTFWNLSPESFAKIATGFFDLGACMVGGCCGTTPEHIRNLRILSDNKALQHHNAIRRPATVTSYSQRVDIDGSFKIIGEKINPTGNKPLKEAIKKNAFEYVSTLAIEQYNAGAHIIDVNAGMPGFDEVDLLHSFMLSVQKVCPAPLMIDSSNIEALEKACRYYNGKPFINSVSGKKSSLAKVLPIAQKYGGVLIALTLDDDGIPKTAEDRVNVALNIIAEARKYGIPESDIVVDPLTLTISSDSKAAITTINAIKLLNEKGIKTSIGLSNISFGLPQREYINATFLSQCLMAGLSAAILNPASQALMNTYYGHNALWGFDESCSTYIDKMSSIANITTSSNNDISLSLKDYIEQGLREDSIRACRELIENMLPLDIVSTYIVPALDKVGETYEKGITYLPQLLMSAEAAQGAFSVLHEKLQSTGQKDSGFKGKVVVATVKGDIHDIGKNIAKVLLENYGYHVIDLGKDVAPEIIVDTVVSEKAKLVGLSALMTTTLPNMEETIKLLREKNVPCKIVVGGAVLTESYAANIGADFYCKDAMATVKYAEQLYKQ